MSVALSKVYAQLPPSLVRRVAGNGMVMMNITTANLRRALKMKDLEPWVKNRLYAIQLNRRYYR